MESFAYQYCHSINNFGYGYGEGGVLEKRQNTLFFTAMKKVIKLIVIS
jgi:hypothetical protein